MYKQSENDKMINEKIVEFYKLDKNIRDINKFVLELGISKNAIMNRATRMNLTNRSNANTKWTQEEYDLVENNLNKTSHGIYKIFLKNGYNRTPIAISKIKAQLSSGMDLNRSDCGEYSINHLAMLTGISNQTIKNYIDGKKLKACKEQDNLWIIKKADLKKFIVDYLPSIDITKFDKYFLIDVLNDESGIDDIVTKLGNIAKIGIKMEDADIWISKIGRICKDYDKDNFGIKIINNSYNKQYIQQYLNHIYKSGHWKKIGKITIPALHSLKILDYS